MAAVADPIGRMAYRRPSSVYCRLERGVHGHGIGSQCLVKAASCFVDGHLLAEFSRGRRGRETCWGLFHEGANPIHDESPPSTSKYYHVGATAFSL